jgi:hypothetical protein
LIGLSSQQTAEISAVLFKVSTKPLFSNMPVLHEVDEVLLINLREIVGNDNGGAISATFADGLEDEKSGRDIES